MGIARIILVAFVVLSVAIAPVVAGAMPASQSAHASMSDDGDMPCKSADDGKAIGCCAPMCFNLLAVIDFQTTEAPRSHTVEFLPVDEAVHPHSDSPPTHPPTS
jgi:hypothetical protein